MPIEWRWFDEMKDIILVTYTHPVRTWDEYILANQAIMHAAASVHNAVHIIHAPGNIAMPLGNPLPHLNAVANMKPHNASILALVNNLVAKYAMNTVLKAYFLAKGKPSPFRFITDLESEVALIVAKRQNNAAV